MEDDYDGWPDWSWEEFAAAHAHFWKHQVEEVETPLGTLYIVKDGELDAWDKARPRNRHDHR